MEDDELRLECLREAVKYCTSPVGNNGGRKPLELAKEFAGFVLGLEYNEETEEWVDPDQDDSEIKPSVRAFDDEGQEL